MRKQITISCLLFLMIHTTVMAQWQNIGSGIFNPSRNVFSISAVNENVVWAVATHTSFQNSFDYTLTTDGGVTWNAGLLPDTIGDYYPGHIFALNDQTAWVIMINLPQQDRIRIFKTSNGGNAWQEQTGEFNTSGIAFAALHFFNANEGIGFGSPGTGDPAVDSLRIYRTSDGGNSWLRISAASLPLPLANEGVWVNGDNRYESKGDTLWFVTRASRVFRTTDRGLTWLAFSAGISGDINYPGLASIAFQNSIQGIVTTHLPSQAARTSDGGETWVQIPIPSSPPAADIEYIPGTNASYLIHEDWFDGSLTTTNYLKTHNGGDTWDTLSFSPSIKVIKFLSPTVGFGGSQIFSSDSGGIYKWIGNFSDSIFSSINIAPQENLAVNVYPNPAKNNVVIKLSDNISLQNNLSLNLFNSFGQSVKRISIYSKLTNIDLNELSSGLYFYHLQDKQNIFHVGKVIKE